MYIKISDNGDVEYPYPVQKLMVDAPEVSFPDFTEEILGSFGVHPVEEIKPSFDSLKEELIAGEPFFDSGWKVEYSISPLSPEEISENISSHNLAVKQRRLFAYQQEADPLYFEWVAGEGSKEAWLEKRQEIEDRFPYTI